MYLAEGQYSVLIHIHPKMDFFAKSVIIRAVRRYIFVLEHAKKA